MTFDDILDQAIAMLQRRKRLSYRALKRQFDLDDEYLEDLKLELIKVQQLAVDQSLSMCTAFSRQVEPGDVSMWLSLED